jgi:hypothetical protein
MTVRKSTVTIISFGRYDKYQLGDLGVWDRTVDASASPRRLPPRGPGSQAFAASSAQGAHESKLGLTPAGTNQMRHGAFLGVEICYLLAVRLGA